jgi:hypothetical protein
MYIFGNFSYRRDVHAKMAMITPDFGLFTYSEHAIKCIDLIVVYINEKLHILDRNGLNYQKLSVAQYLTHTN